MLKPRFAAFLLLLAVPCAPAFCASPIIKYTVSYAPQTSTSAWEVSAAVYNAPRSTSPFVVELSSWGDWGGLGDAYSSGFTAEPPATLVCKNHSSCKIFLPEDGDGSFRVRYRLSVRPWPAEKENPHPILPFCSDEYCSGFTENTLCEFSLYGHQLDAERTLRFDIPSGWRAATGWGEPGPANGPVVLDGKNEPGVITFGKNTRTASAETGGVRYQVFQNGLEKDITPETLKVIQQLYGFYIRLMDAKPNKPVSLFISGVNGPGTNTEHGIRLSVKDPDDIRSADNRRFLAHELFHDWLGRMLTESTGEKMVWFKEGFTEYMAYRTLLDTGLADADWFTERLTELDRNVRENKANAAAVLGKSDISWREHNADLEHLAYDKGCLTAFYIDARLRAEKKGSLAAMLRDLLHRPGSAYDQEAVQTWLKEHGLGDFVNEYIMKPGTPSLEETMRLIGYELRTTAVPLAYLGIDCDDPPNAIRKIDPAGPAAQAGILEGDYIYGYIFANRDALRISPAVTTPYRFGMTIFDPQQPAVIDIKRGEERLRVKVMPKAIEGGLLPVFHPADPAAEKTGLFLSLRK